MQIAMCALQWFRLETLIPRFFMHIDIICTAQAEQSHTCLASAILQRMKAASTTQMPLPVLLTMCEPTKRVREIPDISADLDLYRHLSTILTLCSRLEMPAHTAFALWQPKHEVL